MSSVRRCEVISHSGHRTLIPGSSAVLPPGGHLPPPPEANVPPQDFHSYASFLPRPLGPAPLPRPPLLCPLAVLELPKAPSPTGPGTHQPGTWWISVSSHREPSRCTGNTGEAVNETFKCKSKAPMGQASGRAGAVSWSGLDTATALGLRHCELRPRIPLGGEGLSLARLREPQTHSDHSLMCRGTLPPVLNIPLFSCGSVSKIKCNSRWEACDIFSVNTDRGWDRRPCQLTCKWKGPEGSLRLK